mmetsp:Transcript_42280/g.117736  ORF Transcript_42280/g.117736 Transcript_42280/m.117736 type:complete len:326 (-) Transcript_42280:185-1162(-)
MCRGRLLRRERLQGHPRWWSCARRRSATPRHRRLHPEAPQGRAPISGLRLCAPGCARSRWTTFRSHRPCRGLPRVAAALPPSWPLLLRLCPQGRAQPLLQHRGLRRRPLLRLPGPQPVGADPRPSRWSCARSPSATLRSCRQCQGAPAGVPIWLRPCAPDQPHWSSSPLLERSLSPVLQFQRCPRRLAGAPSGPHPLVHGRAAGRQFWSRSPARNPPLQPQCCPPRLEGAPPGRPPSAADHAAGRQPCSQSSAGNHPAQPQCCLPRLGGAHPGRLPSVPGRVADHQRWNRSSAGNRTSRLRRPSHRLYPVVGHRVSQATWRNQSC